jgi:hypothetical protein
MISVNAVSTLPAQNLDLLRLKASGKYNYHPALEARIAWLWLDERGNVV